MKNSSAAKSTAPTVLIINDNGKPLDSVVVDAEGNWHLTIPNLAVGEHTFEAASLDGSTVSNSWKVRVEALPPELIVNPNPVTLTGLFYWLNGYDVNLVNWPAGTTETRVAAGGIPPYSYTSSNTDAVRVDSNGKITARRNGTALITVRDASNQTGQFSVTVTGARELSIKMNSAGWGQMTGAAGGWNGLLINPDQAQSILTMYGTNWPSNVFEFWAAPNYSGSVVKCLRMNQFQDIVDARGWGSALGAMIVVR